MGFFDVIKLLRPQQWYKNLLIFLPLIFVGKLFDYSALIKTFYGFIVLCGISSTNYIINDFIDREKDKLHPEKKNRPFASEAISPLNPLLILFEMITLSVWLWSAIYLGKPFFYAAAFLLLFTQLYSLVLKHQLFLDILSIGVNFVVRAISGAFVIDVKISPWLVLCTFFLSLYLSTGKRHAEVLLLGEKAKQVRETLGYYTKELTTPLLIISTTLLIASYSLYSFLSDHKNLVITIPFALYVIFLYYNYIITGNKIARHPEHVFFDKKMMLGMALWGVSTILLLYMPVLGIWK